MKTTSHTLASLVLLVMILAVRSSSVSAQTAQTMKWKFGGNDAGTSTYKTNADGTFESTTELNVAGTSLKSRLTGKLVEGAITEFELVTQQAGTEVTLSAKDGKARLKAGEVTRDITYKP